MKEDGNRLILPLAQHTLSKIEKKLFCKRLYDIKMPDVYTSNISNCVILNECKLVGLESYDCHVLMQYLLVVAICGLLPKSPRIAIFRLCNFFNDICQKALDTSMLDALENEVAITM